MTITEKISIDIISHYNGVGLSQLETMLKHRAETATKLARERAQSSMDKLDAEEDRCQKKEQMEVQ